MSRVGDLYGLDQLGAILGYQVALAVIDDFDRDLVLLRIVCHALDIAFSLLNCVSVLSRLIEDDLAEAYSLILVILCDCDRILFRHRCACRCAECELELIIISPFTSFEDLLDLDLALSQACFVGVDKLYCLYKSASCLSDNVALAVIDCFDRYSMLCRIVCYAADRALSLLHLVSVGSGLSELDLSETLRLVLI